MWNGKSFSVMIIKLIDRLENIDSDFYYQRSLPKGNMLDHLY